MNNADNLIDSILFNSNTSLNEVVFPGTHTFFVKWPLFWIFGIFGRDSIYIGTILIYIITVFLVILIIHYFIKNSLIESEDRLKKYYLLMNISILIFNSLLLFVGAQTEIGSLVPIGMGMISTRNIEYAIFLYTTIFIINNAKSSLKLKFRGYARISILSFLLIFSDHLFIPLYLGFIIGLLFIKTIKMRVNRKFEITQDFLNTLKSLITIGGVIFFTVIISFLLDSCNILNFNTAGYDNNESISPYKLNINASFSEILIAIWRAILDLIGANSFINILLIILSLISQVLIIIKILKNVKDSILSLMVCGLLFASILDIVAYISTEHNYYTDSRYLAIISFWELFSLIFLIRWLVEQNSRLKVCISILAITLIINSGFGVFYQYYTDKAQSDIFSERSDKNLKIIQKIEELNLPKILVGDYWRVVPIASYDYSITPIMINNCKFTRRGELTTQKWYKADYDEYTYLLSLDNSSMAGFPNCNQEDTYSLLDKPEQQVVIKGSEENPEELLLVYKKKILPTNSAN